MLSDARILGGIGSIFVLLTAIPNVGWLLGVAGFVMILLAINNISRVVNEKKIFDNMLTAIILAVGALAVGAVTVVGVLHNLLGMGSFVGSRFIFASGLTASNFLGLAIPIVAGLVVIWALLVVSGVFVRRGYDLMASKLNISRFRTAGLLYLIGAATSIIGVGLVLIFVAQILLALSFFAIPEQTSVSQSSQVQIVTTPG